MTIDFASSYQNEMLVYEEFKKTREKMFPMPEKPNVTLMRSLGWQFIFVVVQGIFAILLASLRTAKMFYTAAGNSWVAFPEAVSAIIAVEFGIVVFAAIRAEAANRNSTEASINISTAKLWTGEIVGILISVIAGLGVSFDGFGINVENLNYALSVTMGIGASLIAAVSGEIIGTVLARFGNIQDAAKKAYFDGVEKWQTDMNDAWEKSPERKIIRDAIETQKQVLQAERVNFVRSVKGRTDGENAENQQNGSVRVLRTFSENTENQQNGSLEVLRTFDESSLAPAAKQIFEYLDKNATSTHTPTLSEIMEKVGVAKSYASTTSKKWKEVRGWPGEFPASENEPVQ